MTIIEGRYIGSYKTPDWGQWYEWRKYPNFEARKVEIRLGELKKQFAGLYEFRKVKL